MSLCPHNRPSGEPVSAPAYPIPPPGEYYATARWVKDFVNQAILSVDSTGVKELIDNLLATWDPSFAMKKVSGVDGQFAQFDSQGQVVGSGAKIEDFVTHESLNTVTDAVSGKVDKVPGKGLSTNDFTNELKQKLESLTPGSGGGGSGILVDESLSVRGAAADASAAGAAIAAISEALDRAVEDARNQAESAARDAAQAVSAVGTARSKFDNVIYDPDGNATADTYASSKSVTAVEERLAGKASQEALDFLGGQVTNHASELQRLASVNGEFSGVINTINEILARKADSETVNSELANKADKTELANKADVSALDDKADKTALDDKADRTELANKANVSDLANKANRTELANKANVSDLDPLRSKTDLQVYNNDGQPAADDKIATEKWVTTFLSGNYDVAENTSYGTGE